MLAGSPVYVAAAQINTLDMGLAFFLSGGRFALASGYPILFWACCAFAVLSKGLVGIVLPLATLGLYILLKRDWRLICGRPADRRADRVPADRRAVVHRGLAAQSRVRAFLLHPGAFPALHHGSASAHGAGLVLPAGASRSASRRCLLPAAMGWWRGLRSPAPPFDAVFWLALWALVVLAFFSASSSKLPAYILPMFPALALLAGRYLAAADRKLMLVQGAIVAALGIAAAAPPAGKGGAAYASYVPWLVAAGAVTAVLGAASLFTRKYAVIALAAAGFLATQLAIIGHGTISERFSAAALIASIEPKPPANVPVYAVDTYDHTLPWYLRRTVTMVAYRDELGAAVDWDQQPVRARRWPSSSAAGRRMPMPMPSSAVAQFDKLASAAADEGDRARRALRVREEAMTLASFAFILTGVLLNAGAQLLLKAGTNAVPLGLRLAIEPHILAGLACYVVSVVVWVVALSKVPVSMAYPMLSIGYVVNAIAAYYLLGEAVTPMRLAGIGVIIVGVFIVARS